MDHTETYERIPGTPEPPRRSRQRENATWFAQGFGVTALAAAVAWGSMSIAHSLPAAPAPPAHPAASPSLTKGIRMHLEPAETPTSAPVIVPPVIATPVPVIRPPRRHHHHAVVVPTTAPPVPTVQPTTPLPSPTLSFTTPPPSPSPSLTTVPPPSPSLSVTTAPATIPPSGGESSIPEGTPTWTPSPVISGRTHIEHTYPGTGQAGRV